MIYFSGRRSTPPAPAAKPAAFGAALARILELDSVITAVGTARSIVVLSVAMIIAVGA